MLCPFRISGLLSPTFFGRAARSLIAVLFFIGILPTPVLAQAPTQRQLRIASDNLARSLSSLSDALNKASEAAAGNSSEAIALRKVLSERRQTVNLVHALAGKLNQAKLGVRSGGSAGGNDAAKSSAQSASLAPCKPPCTVSKAQLDVVQAAVSELAKTNVKDDLEAIQGAAESVVPVGVIIGAVLAIVAAVIVLVGTLIGEAVGGHAATEENEETKTKADRRNGAKISRGSKTPGGSKITKNTVTAIPCGTPANPCNPGSSKGSKSILKGGLLDTGSGFSAGGPSPVHAPAGAPPPGRGLMVR
jgi:hypothetical protein